MFADARAEATVPTRSIEIARGFYEAALGLVPVESHTPQADVVYACAGSATPTAACSACTTERS